MGERREEHINGRIADKIAVYAHAYICLHACMLEMFLVVLSLPPTDHPLTDLLLLLPGMMLLTQPRMTTQRAVLTY